MNRNSKGYVTDVSFWAAIALYAAVIVVAGYVFELCEGQSAYSLLVWLAGCSHQFLSAVAGLRLSHPEILA